MTWHLLVYSNLKVKKTLTIIFMPWIVVSKCKAANWIINADKTRKMFVSFSRTHSVCDYVFVDGKLIDKVDDFKYLGTFFGANLKWSSNTDHIYKKLKQRFFAFSKFKHFKPDEQQRNHLIRS